MGMVGCTHWVWSETDCWLIKWMTFVCDVHLSSSSFSTRSSCSSSFSYCFPCGYSNHIECCSSAWPVHYNLHYNRWSSGRCPASCRKCRRCLRHGFRDLNGDLSAWDVERSDKFRMVFGIKTDPQRIPKLHLVQKEHPALEKLCLEKKTSVTCHQGVCFTR